MSKSTLNKILLLCVIIAGCYTQKAALKQMQKAQLKHPEVVAKFANEQYPPQISKVDTVVNVDTGYIMVPVYNTDTIKLTIFDKSPAEIIKVDKIKVVTKTVTITKSVADSAKIKELLYQLSQCSTDKEQTKDKRDKLIFWLLVALCVSLLVNLLIYMFK